MAERGIDMTREQTAKTALGIIERFIDKNEIGCAETIYQSDRVIQNAYEFIEELCELAGYYSEENS